MYKQLKAKSNQFSAKIISILGTIIIIARDGEGEKGRRGEGEKGRRGEGEKGCRGVGE